MSVIPGKELQSNCSYAGNPVRKVAEDIFWDGSCVNVWTEEKTKSMEFYECDKFIFNFNENEYISYDEIDEKLCLNINKAGAQLLPLCIHFLDKPLKVNL